MSIWERYLGFKLSKAQLKQWDDDGFLLLRGAVSPSELEAVQAVVDGQWSEKSGNYHHIDVNSGPHGGRWWTMDEVPLEARDESYKLNNLFVRYPEIRNAALSARLKIAMSTLLGGEPVICNSLNFERGSQQEPHIDSWFMPAPVGDKMAAVSITLDTVDDENGPIFFYPGSHKIPPFRFTGDQNFCQEDDETLQQYLRDEIAKRQLEIQSLRAEPGDVFIWHGQLLHGGRAIRDFSRTRRSLVVHYWRRQDVPETHMLVDQRGAYLRNTLRGEISV